MSTTRSVTRVVTTTTVISTNNTTDTNKQLSMEMPIPSIRSMKNTIREKTYEEILMELKGKRKLWEDESFPAESISIFLNKNNKQYREFEWKRPKNICKTPKFFTKTINPPNIQLGNLSNRSLLTSISSLFISEPIFKNVVPDDQNFDNNYIGAFQFHFWRFGTWVDIIVDDRLPTYQDKLCCMQSDNNDDFWCALLEKAYAKFYGSYESLNGISLNETMEDFTGGLSETIRLIRKMSEPEFLFKQLLKLQYQSTWISGLIKTSQNEKVLKNGLITNHFYIITVIQQIKLINGKYVKLIKIRNPWRIDTKWNGKWCINSTEWNDISEEDKINSNLNCLEGEFWMSVDDFLQIFTRLEVCHLDSDLVNENNTGKIPLEIIVNEGSWIKNCTAGGCHNFIDSFISNPQYCFEVINSDDDNTNMGTVIVGVMQKDMRLNNVPLFIIGYDIYKIKDFSNGILNKSFFKDNKPVSRCPIFTNLREVCWRHNLPLGIYVIIPSTFKPNEETSFLLRIASETTKKTELLDGEMGKIEIAKHLTFNKRKHKLIEYEEEMKKLFVQTSKSLEVINACQLQNLLKIIMKKEIKNFDGFGLEVCRSMIALTDIDHVGTMKFQKFMGLLKNLEIWKTAFKEFDLNNDGVFDAFEFRNSLNNVGISLSNLMFKLICNRYTNPENQVIGFEDFIMAIVRLTNAFESMVLQPQDEDGRYVFSTEELIESMLCM